jgi:multidrug efflux pump subunit AcrA (membrane-fusion protein)
MGQATAVSPRSVRVRTKSAVHDSMEVGMPCQIRVGSAANTVRFDGCIKRIAKDPLTGGSLLTFEISFLTHDDHLRLRRLLRKQSSESVRVALYAVAVVAVALSGVVTFLLWRDPSHRTRSATTSPSRMNMLDRVHSLSSGVVAAGRREIVRNPVRAAASATIHLATGDRVHAGDVLARLTPTGGRVPPSVQPTVLTAPFGGLVTSIMIESGDTVAFGDGICEIADESKLSAEVPVAEVDAARLKVGMEGRLSVAGTGEDLRGTIVRLPGIVRSLSQGRAVIMEISLPRDDRVRLGATVEAEFIVGGREGVLSLPSTAVHLGGGRATVCVVTETNEIAAREVQLGVRDGSRVEIRTGLDENERVLVDAKRCPS